MALSINKKHFIFGVVALRHSANAEVRSPDLKSVGAVRNNMKGYLYILQSLKNNSYYIGNSTNLINRIKQHNAGKVKSTCNKRPYKLVFNQEFDNLLSAHKAELIIKKWKRKDYIKKVIINKHFKTKKK